MKKLFATLLALALALSLLPVQVLAVNGTYAAGDDTALRKTVRALTTDSGTADTAHAGHPVCGASCSHTGADAHTDETWKAWTETDSLPAGGQYYLTADVTISASWQPANGSTLCLNGHSITSADNTYFNVITILDGYSFTLTDCAETPGKITHAATATGGGVYMRDYTTFNMYGGEISGNAVSEGGGVYVGFSGIFNMYGGAIKNNRATSQNPYLDTPGCGGGVFVVDATFNMYGGEISGNQSLYKYGGGVCAAKYSSTPSFNMYGGTITGNTAKLGGGNVYAVGANFNITDGTIDGEIIGDLALGGQGTPADPYRIYTAENLKQFRTIVSDLTEPTRNPNAHAKLMNDIVLNDGTFGDDGNYTPGASDKAVDPWTPIGTISDPYTGTFNGNGHTISGLYVTGSVSAGLFGYTSGTIQNLAVTGYVKGKTYAGGIAGYVKGGSIEGCVNLCSVLASDSDGDDVYAGGIAGYLAGGSVKNCANLKAISADGSGKCYAGGIAGYMAAMNDSRPEISGCYNVGSITGTTKTGTVRTGSIAGWANYSTIANCRWLLGTAEQIAREFSSDDEFMKHAKSRAQFADGTELDSLKGGNPDSPWAKTGYLAAADMTLPLLSWQTADEHTCNTDGVLGGCTCGLLGKGTEDAPHKITTAEDLKAFRDLVNCDKFSNSYGKARCAKLMADIVLNAGTFDDDGNWSEGDTPDQWEPIDAYTGTFDGGGYAIKGLYVKYDNGTRSGLFGDIDKATIQNLTVTGYISTKSQAGGIVAYVDATSGSVTIKNCVNDCTVRGINGSAGGIVGYLNRGSLSISGCANYGTVIGDTSSAGGIVGYGSSDGEEISFQGCLNTGLVEGGTSSGGIAGQIRTNSSLTDCINTGAVKGTNSNTCTGGIVSGFFGSGDGTMTSCYSVGTVTAPEGAASGGLIGEVDNRYTLTATNSYWLTGTAENAIGTPAETPDNTSAKTKAEFANDVLSLLQDGDKNSPWTKTGYNSKLDMTLPLLSWQTADDHTHDGAQWLSDAASHWKVCSCGAIYDKAAHSGGTATCKDKAVCAVCGAAYGALDPNNHVGGTEMKNAKSATCTEKGYTGDTYCKSCGIKLSDGKDIPSAGHDLKHVDAKRSTTRTEGNSEYWYCDSCGKYFRDAAAAKEITKADTVIAKRSGNSGFTGTTSGTASGTGKDTVKSSDTGDAGIALYGVMALLSLSGGAWLRRKGR